MKLKSRARSLTGPFSWDAYFARFLLAAIIVFGTYNPSGYSYFHWALSDISEFNLLKTLIGLVLLIGWVVFLRATRRSLGYLGIILSALFFGLLFWVLIDLIKMPVASDVIQYLLLIVLSLVLTTGLSWSHIRRRLTGQMDVDDVSGMEE
ncbi:MAG: DUF6524 family protein [Pseudomonadota bacterium]|nr:DUF6524 family protein [Pseudomonadota bacterium]